MKCKLEKGENGLIGIVDENGKWILDPEYTSNSFEWVNDWLIMEIEEHRWLIFDGGEGRWYDEDDVFDEICRDSRDVPDDCEYDEGDCLFCYYDTDLRFFFPDGTWDLYVEKEDDEDFEDEDDD